MSLSLNVRKRLDHFTLEVAATLPDSGVHAVVGPSGAGKSTLLRLIAGLDAPDQGSVIFCGAPFADTARSLHIPPWKRPVGMVFQDSELFAHLSLRQNVLFAAPDPMLADDLMRRVGVWHLRDALPARVSGGERQRAAVCQALARRPALLLLDEPFSALDAVTRREIGDMLAETSRQEGLPMILVTHDLDEALALADTLLCIERGRVSPQWLGLRIDEMERSAARNRALFQTKRIAKEAVPCS